MMFDSFTFSQCLTKVMHKYALSFNGLASLIGSRADLRSVLADDGTSSKRARLYEKLLHSHLFSEEDYHLLAHALEVSRLGPERYRFQQAIDDILSGKTPASSGVIVTDSGKTLKQHLDTLKNATSIEMICFNACVPSLFAALSDLFVNQDLPLHFQHYLQSSPNWNTAAEYISIVMPLLFDERYHPALIANSPYSSTPCLSGNLLFIRAIIQEEPLEMHFVIADNNTAYEIENASSSRLFDFVCKVLKNIQPEPTPIKEQSPYCLDFPSLCMTFLSHELNRSTYSIFNDLCFQQIPTDIAINAFLDKGVSSDDEPMHIIQRTLSIHEQRYQNQYLKKKPTYRIMTLDGCKRFLETGMLTDHFVGFRGFTYDERKIIFENMLNAAQSNPNFIPLLLKSNRLSHKYNLVCYDKLGVSLDVKDTNYDISQGYRSVFLMLPEFTRQYMEYYLDILVAEKCYSRKESMELLQEIYQSFLASQTDK